MPFDLTQIRSVEFGVCSETSGSELFRVIPTVTDVQDALVEMVMATHAAIFDGTAEVQEFSPAEKYAQNERLTIPLDSDMVTKHREIYEAENLLIDADALSDPSKLIGYFVVLRDQSRNKLMAFRRAAQFKGILRKKLIRFSDDALRIVQDEVFKLDHDFDFYIVDGKVWIWRPSGFEFSADIEGHIAASSTENVATVSARIPCVNFDNLRVFVAGHKRAMRLMAAIKSRNDLERTSLRKLKAYCVRSGVKLEGRNGVIWPQAGHEMQFLMVLDRRRYQTQITDDDPEIYEAASRRRTE